MNRSTGWFLLLGGLMAGLWLVLALRPGLEAVTRLDLAGLRFVARFRAGPLTALARGVASIGAGLLVQLIAWGTIVALVAVRRFQHLATYLVVLLVASLLGAAVGEALGRMRPSGVPILGAWEGYAHPSRPVAAAALVLTGVLFTLVPSGRWRRRGAWVAVVLLLSFGAARLYLGVDHPTDVFAGLVLGAALPVVVYRLAVPDDVFPVAYRRGRRAHLDVSGRRQRAIVKALDEQLALDVVAIRPFGLEGSAGSTPLHITTRSPGEDVEQVLFGKLYALVHLRSDRSYKFLRTIRYGRLEDEKPFSSVRRLVEYEDHLLRLLRDAGLPTPRPYGFVEITPEREYVVVMEFFPGAVEIGEAEVGDGVIDEGLAIVRRLWDVGVAHRDIKPSNVLVRDGHVLLIDVAFATVRPTPWRQAVDLANMMLTLALRSSPDVVHRRALRFFAADDIAEAFAACRGVTLPTQLRNRIQADGRDLVGAFRRLAPAHSPVAVQLWGVRRVALTLALVGGLALAVPLVLAYIDAVGLR